jgi:hypothetical protein
MMNARTLLTREGRAAWRAIEPRLRRRGVFWDGRAGGRFELFVLCATWELYRLTRAEAARARGPIRRQLRREAEKARRNVREIGAKFFDLIPLERARLAPVGRDGEDQEIARWFTGEKGHRRAAMNESQRVVRGAASRHA